MFHSKILKKDVKSPRPAKLGQEIRVIISDLIMKAQIPDKVLFDVSITISEVLLSSDISHGKVYFYPLGNNLDAGAILKALNKHVGFFRKHIGKNLHIRVVPDLEFILDNQFDRLEEVEEMFKKIK
jgi:ribosome-binding factor A